VSVRIRCAGDIGVPSVFMCCMAGIAGIPKAGLLVSRAQHSRPEAVVEGREGDPDGVPAVHHCAGLGHCPIQRVLVRRKWHSRSEAVVEGREGDPDGVRGERGR